ncbi:MAG: hypothetical protein OER87_13245 [Gammaproteobacteria bacterium]|nr:hypothetical protein [Gammaproteobacteria bacterium]
MEKTGPLEAASCSECQTPAKVSPSIRGLSGLMRGQRLVAFIPGFAERLVEAGHVAAHAHHPFERG